MLYEIAFKDGSVSRARVLDGSIEDIIKTWPSELQASVVNYVPADEFTARPEAPRMLRATAIQCSVAELPANGTAVQAVVINGRKPGEAEGAGTGVLAFRVGAVWSTATGEPVLA